MSAVCVSRSCSVGSISRPTVSPSAETRSRGTAPNRVPSISIRTASGRRGGGGMERRNARRSVHRLAPRLVPCPDSNADRRAHAEEFLDLALNFGEEHRIVPQEELGVFAALTDALVAVGVPGSRFLDDAGFGCEVDQQRGVADAFIEHDIELGLPERWRCLVLDDFDPHMVADYGFPLLERPDSPDIEPE